MESTLDRSGLQRGPGLSSSHARVAARPRAPAAAVAARAPKIYSRIFVSPPPPLSADDDDHDDRDD